MPSSLVINGEEIPEQALTAELLQISSGLEADAPQARGMDAEVLRSAAVRNVVRRTLLLQMAAARELRVTQQEADAERTRHWGSSTNTVCGSGVRDAIMDDLLVQRASDDLTRHVPRPGRVEAEQFYRRNLQIFRLEQAVQTAHIIRNIHSESDEQPAMETMKRAQTELEKGKSFAQVADRYSDCGGIGGSLGWVTQGQMVPEFEAVVFALAPGSRSGIFRTVFGLHIATALRKRAAGHRPFEEVRLEIASRLFAERRSAALERALRHMEQQSQIHFKEAT